MSAESLAAPDLRYVVCPVCHQPLESAGNIISCRGCGRRYPVIDGIPVLLADRVL
jgi:hypothetical protein